MHSDTLKCKDDALSKLDYLFAGPFEYDLSCKASYNKQQNFITVRINLHLNIKHFYSRYFIYRKLVKNFKAIEVYTDGYRYMAFECRYKCK